MANERLDRFTKLLKEIFELDKSDLDFGIYRVMNLRKTEIETFLTERLPQMVQETLAPFAQGSKEKSYSQMAQIEESAAAMGMTIGTLPDTAPMKQKYVQLQKQLAEGADLAALETDVYSALYAFFNRYYEDGDFISKRRYKEGVYAIPYEGEEVKLYWANQDQYYIKTSENFKDYTFAFDGITAHFRLVDATTEQNNNKESKDSKRTFMLFVENEENYPGIKTFEYDADAGEIVIRFVYDVPEDKKKKYAEENYAAITKWLLSLRRAEVNPLIAPVPTGKGKETTTLLEKHLKGYVAKNTFDYFIHKDLRGFLTRELDFYIKSEVTIWDDVDTATDATKELEDILGMKTFETPKPVSLMTKILQQTTKGNECTLDFFSGSGTTGHAVINMNRLDCGNRKYILVEMGEYFSAVTKPRIKKVVYSSDWSKGNPLNRESGVPQIIKYITLESYEDALSNIEFSDNGSQLASLLGEDYLIHYMVDLESRGSLLNVEAFSNPFSYTMKITEKNECKQRGIDLCETFNYLIGLKVTNQSAISYFLSKPAEAPTYEGAVDLVSDISGQYAFRQIEGTLPDGRRTLVIWRTVTEDVIASNAALDAYFTSYRKNAQNRSYDVIFVNGDSNLENLRGGNEGWNVQMTEIEFKKRMFEEV